jgi:hypothetical protein
MSCDVCQFGFLIYTKMKTVTDDHPITIHVSFKFYQYSSIWENVLKLCPAEVEFFDSSQLITDH